MKQIPSTWAMAPIGDLCDLKNGRAFKPIEWTSEGLPIVRIQNLNNKNAQFNYYSGAYEDKYYLKGGELLFAWSGTPGTSFGAHEWRGGEALLNQHIFRVDFDKNFLDRRLFRHAINQQLSLLISKAHGGAGLQHVTKGKFEATEIAVPPLNEQRRVADKLDTTLARVDALNDQLARITPLLKRFRQSVLAAATSGRLTEDLRSSANLSAWVKVPTETVSDFQSGFAFKSEIFKSQGDYQIIKLANVKQNNLNLSAAPAFVDKKDVLDCLKFAPNVGDILISMTGTKYKKDYGFACLIKQEIKCLVNQRVGRFIPDMGKIIPYYFLLSLMSEEFREQFFEGETGGVNQGNVGAKHIKSCTINLPSLAEQTEIVRRVETLFAFADRLEARLQSAQTAAERLTPALLAKAFRGELVPQDPSDEPATELLRRLREARAADTASKPKRGRAAKAPTVSE